MNNDNNIINFTKITKMMKQKRFTLTAILFFICCSLFAEDNLAVVNAKVKTIQEMLTEALKYQRKPYVAGANGPDSFDGPGFAQFMYKQLGLDIPQNAAEQAKTGKKISKKKDLVDGDLVFFQAGNNDKSIGMVGIIMKKKNGDAFDFLYVSTSEGVTIGSDDNESFKDAFIQGARITSDKELNDIRKAYAAKQKAIEKAGKEVEKKKADVQKAEQKAEKAQADADKATKNIEKVKADAEKAADKAAQNAAKAKADVEKAKADAEKATNAYNTLNK